MVLHDEARHVTVCVQALEWNSEELPGRAIVADDEVATRSGPGQDRQIAC